MRDLIETIDARGVATLTLNRPARHNALDDALIATMSEALVRLDASSEIRIVAIDANGPSFCAGGDIGWMRRMAEASAAENRVDALALAGLLTALDNLSKPTLALVHGSVYGGGVGLVACCDIVLAADNARFCLSEVRLGLVPAIVGPFILRSIGARHARRLILTAEEMPVTEALRIGLVHRIASEDQMELERDAMIEALLAGAPGAQREAKSLLALYAHHPLDAELMKLAAHSLADRRASPEGREGLNAFLEKRPAVWRVFR
jgi:methylglutaconyl-CoA hydratase